MSATNTTTHYNLPSFVATDKPAWLVDWNGAMASIDAGIYRAQQTADTNTSDISGVQGSVTTLAGTVESQGLTISTLSQSLTTAIGNINTINSLIGNGTPTTTDQTIIGAINEINARTGEAKGISYDNTDSGLSATNVQSAIDEIKALFSPNALTESIFNVANNVTIATEDVRIIGNHVFARVTFNTTNPSASKVWASVKTNYKPALTVPVYGFSNISGSVYTAGGSISASDGNVFAEINEAGSATASSITVKSDWFI